MDYPFFLDRSGIEALIPHRHDIFVCERIKVLGPHDFVGVARWSSANALLKGHFPGLAMVPGVFLIEAMAQLTGAGLLAGDPYVQSLTGDWVGVLAAVRKCAFKAPVMPDTDVEYQIHCRQLGPLAVQVTGTATVLGQEAAQLDFLMAYAERASLLAALP